MVVRLTTFLVPYTQANLAPVPEALDDRQVRLLADIASTGSSASETARVNLGKTIAVFAQGPVGLWASLGARLKSAGLVIAVGSVSERLGMGLRIGADLALKFESIDVVAEIRRTTLGRGVDVAIEALGTSGTSANGVRAIRPRGKLPSRGTPSHDLGTNPSDDVGGTGGQTIGGNLWPGPSTHGGPDADGGERAGRPHPTSSTCLAFPRPRTSSLISARRSRSGDSRLVMTQPKRS